MPCESICVVLTITTIIVSCDNGNDCEKLIPQKWVATQLIDTLLIGSWELIEDNNFDAVNQIITFFSR